MSMEIYTVTIDSKGSAKAEETKPLCIAIKPTEQPTLNYGDNAMEIKTVGVQATETTPYALGAVYSCNLGDGARTFYVLKEEENTVKLILNENMGGMVTWCISGTKNSCEADGAKAYLASQTSGWKLDQEQITLPLYDDVNSVRNSDWIKANIYVGENTLLPYAYWLLEKVSYNSLQALVMRANGLPGSYDVNTSDKVEVRPVITISKADMSL